MQVDDTLPGLSMGMTPKPPLQRSILISPKVKQFRTPKYTESAFAKKMGGTYYPHLERSDRPGAYDAYRLPSVVNGKLEPSKMFKEDL